MFKKLLPKEEKFLDFLKEMSTYILQAAALLNEMLIRFENIGEYKSKIRLIEHHADEVSAKISKELNETFITPIDREDIFSLVHALDNVVDSIDVIANRIFTYKVKAPIEFGPQLSDILLSQAKIIVEVISNLEDHKHTGQKLVAIRDLESEGDTTFQQAITQLFENEKDAIELIKKKEILEILEKAIDRAQRVSIVCEGVLIKNI
ncbi:MAG: DUF47 family protein [Ignavibacteriales bacterium]|nr:MAG: DUF47 family protein [Ignavibacteriales bacterium]